MTELYDIRHERASIADLRDVITYLEAAIRDRDQLMIDLDNATKESHRLRNDLTTCQLERDQFRGLLEIALLDGIMPDELTADIEHAIGVAQ